jgi:hypothetical protein
MVLNSRAAVLLIAMLCPISISSAADISQQRFASQMLDDIIHVTLALYRDRVIAKLQHDGTGAATDYADRKGFVPLPEKFIRQVFLRTLVSHKLAREKQLGLALSADTLSVRLTDQALTQNQQARLVAALLNRMLHAIDDTYTSLVVDKLSVDGTGALYDYPTTGLL